MPAVWDAVRRSVDRGVAPGSYLLTGSAEPDRAPTYTGAGRIVGLRMRPMALSERGVGTPVVSFAALLNQTASSVFGSTTTSLADYAAATATTASYETIRDAATGGDGDKPAKTTTQPYRDVLERLWIVDPVPAWIPSENYLNRLSRSPKHHLADAGLAARALGMDVEALLGTEGIMLGNLFESLVTLSVRVFAQKAEARVGHLWLHGGRHEVDLIVERPDRRVIAIEVKVSAAVRDDDVENLKWLREQIGPALVDPIVINTGPEAYRRKDGIAVVPAALLGP